MSIDVKISKKVAAAYAQASSKPQNLMNAGQFQKGGRTTMVLRTPFVRQIAREIFPEVNDLDKASFVRACEALLDKGHSTIAFDWASRRRKLWTAADIKLFEIWIKRYVHDWSACDDICMTTLGNFLVDHPDAVGKTKAWTKSPNEWMRRASVVALLRGFKKGLFLDEVLIRSDALLKDKQDYVQKGYGWALKEAAEQDQKKVFDFVMARRAVMPRTALRYAIEKMPPALKKQAMA